MRNEATKVGVVIPTRAGDEWRTWALRWVLNFYAREHPTFDVVLGEPPSDVPWSKGLAVEIGRTLLGPVDVLVLADADSVISNPAKLVEAVDLVANGYAPWVVPHSSVFRLKESETKRLYSDPTSRPRTNQVCRAPYVGPAGGGITVLTPDAYDEVGGIDERYLGWGGEDVSFGWALETLVHKVTRLDGRLVHLWHPHPAPNHRGSEESEALVALYTQARGRPRRMRALVAREIWEPLDPLPEPVRFRMTANRRTLRLFGSDEVLRFRGGVFETDDPDTVEALRRITSVREERRK